MVFESIQVLDDVADGDAIERPDLDKAIWHLFVAMPANPFFQANSSALLPALATAICKWKASDDAEKANKPDEKSYMWRAGFYDVLVTVYILCFGRDLALENAGKVLGLYGETFEDYKREFNHA